ncbi:hypothetical protein [Dyadobacter psychrotolerans]|uniref:Uncharacterized protein n=1 Tax=Dyadobacter psychrotolerans TaxID=2541721 RepID=A0A4R5DU22_9BACT|nr:hypothetical protein [Dyadobacter psychrotolerans]TDE18026.1 hypothetical protein E0F88_00265 [Dyadobacter psychrotolerans]
MTKRAFIYFILIFQLLGSQSYAKENKIAKHTKARTSRFYPFINRTKSKIDFLLVKKDKKRVKTIIRADKAKWKEDLSRLLRHRHTTYTFPSFECELSTNFYFLSVVKATESARQTILNFRRILTLPAYYNFLHRLCPI